MTRNERMCGRRLRTSRLRRSEWKRILRVFWRRKLAVIGLALVVLMILVAIFAPFLAPYDPYETDILNKLASPSGEHLLGTDSVGRDTLSRVIYGTRTSLLVAVFAVLLGALIGQLLGLLAGFFGGWVYTIIMRSHRRHDGHTHDRACAWSSRPCSEAASRTSSSRWESEASRGSAA